MAFNTKERILHAALELFSENGYEGTNIQQIADSVGLVKSALYRHFESKEAIWNAILDEMSLYYEQRFGSEANLPAVPATCGELLPLTMWMMNFTIHDEQIVRCRKLLLTEQFHDPRACELATRHFLTGLEAIFNRLFAGMMENGSLKVEDPAMLAFAFTAPITALVHLCDREPQREQEALAQAEAFVTHFIHTYGKETK